MTSGRSRILVLMGGPDGERPVSLRSGRAVASALRGADRFDVITHEIGRPEEFVLELPALLRGADAVFPVLHGRWGEGGPLQRILEEARAAFVGCGAAAAALAMDKARTRDRMLLAGAAVPDGALIGPDDACPIELPLVLKPVDEGSSLNLRVVRDAAALRAARAELHPRVGTLLAERYITGREVTAGMVLGVPLPIVEIIPASSLYDYAAKYERTDTRYSTAPDLPAATLRRCQETVRLAWVQLGLRDLARADFIVDTAGVPWFLEVNTMPGFTSQSLLPMAAAHAGMTMTTLCASLVDAALERGALPHAAHGKRDAQRDAGSSNDSGRASRSTAPWPEPVLDAPVPARAPLSGE